MFFCEQARVSIGNESLQLHSGFDGSHLSFVLFLATAVFFHICSSARRENHRYELLPSFDVSFFAHLRPSSLVILQMLL